MPDLSAFFDDDDDEPSGPVDLVIEDSRWDSAGLEALALAASAAVCDFLRLDPVPCVVVMGCDDARIAALNAQFRGKDRPTNVLSWPAVAHLPHAPGDWPDMPQVAMLGDIAISFDTCQREAAQQAKPVDHHVTHLLVHAMLHLAGFDHENDPDAERMETVERDILRQMGINDPYQEIQE